MMKMDVPGQETSQEIQEQDTTPAQEDLRIAIAESPLRGLGVPVLEIPAGPDRACA
jgi:hypothetical protein